MNIALTVWENRISPVFDAANELLIAEISNRSVIRRRYCHFDPDRITSLTDMLKEFTVSTLICGAISEIPANRLIECGLTLIPFISGNAENILTCFAEGRSIVPGFLMPGCGRRKSGHCSGKGRCIRIQDKKT